MKTAAFIISTVLFLFSGTACFAEEGMVSAGIGAEVRFIYRQRIEVMEGYVTARVDVTDKVPYETKVTDREKDLIVL